VMSYTAYISTPGGASATSCAIDSTWGIKTKAARWLKNLKIMFDRQRMSEFVWEIMNTTHLYIPKNVTYWKERIEGDWGCTSVSDKSPLWATHCFLQRYVEAFDSRGQLEVQDFPEGY